VDVTLAVALDPRLEAANRRVGRASGKTGTRAVRELGRGGARSGVLLRELLRVGVREAADLVERVLLHGDRRLGEPWALCWNQVHGQRATAQRLPPINERRGEGEAPR
jgi:hypothetical protein